MAGSSSRRHRRTAQPKRPAPAPTLTPPQEPERIPPASPVPEPTVSLGRDEDDKTPLPSPMPGLSVSGQHEVVLAAPAPVTPTPTSAPTPTPTSAQTSPERWPRQALLVTSGLTSAVLTFIGLWRVFMPGELGSSAPQRPPEIAQRLPAPTPLPPAPTPLLPPPAPVVVAPPAAPAQPLTPPTPPPVAPVVPEAPVVAVTSPVPAAPVRPETGRRHRDREARAQRRPPAPIVVASAPVAQLTQGMLKDTMQRAEPALQRCIREGWGTDVSIGVVVAPSGQVHQAEVQGAMGQSATGRCIESQVRKLRFPAFTQGVNKTFFWPYHLPAAGEQVAHRGRRGSP